ncbi:tyrosine-type recombinase/integrase [Listeria monocytogenes]|uniref:site-specific integrase n=1 Tax=Listeria monocytogenes TaxID=1639 RepID=UPI001388A3B0|nr:tyrosine-type recombinase/integrase [Listeria monocytogenes]EDN9846537.1 tyrosine-type recombinase/integrase [Listeria monocytogenes]EHQ5231634.1 site-specific integrase [Listeria monocytogenes]EIL5159743.1 site-specific integrase [Listeria monocytogenes]
MASIVKRGNTWQYRVSYKDSEGNYRTKSRGGFSKKKEAILAASEIEKIINFGQDLSIGDMLFATYFQQWFEVYKQGKKGLANDYHYKLAIKFAEKYFPATTLKNLNKAAYQSAINKFAETHTKATVQKRHTYMKACLTAAQQEGIIQKNPAWGIQVFGKVETKKEEEKFISEEELKEITSYISDRKRSLSHYLILIGIATGARFSELTGLTWDCVKEESIIINKSWDNTFKKDFSDTKNKSSNRIITIDKETNRLFKEIKLLLPNVPNEKNLVFLNHKKGTPISNNAVNKVLKHACLQVGIDAPITFHALRHTHGSLLLYKGVNIKYISKRLGHADISTTLQIYSHVLNELEQKESSVVDEVISSLLS